MISLSEYLRKDLPTVDLHGFDSQTGRVAILDFINDNIKMKNPYIVIIHGYSGHILRTMTQEVLSKSRQVEEYHIHPWNPGCTVVKLKFDK